MDKKVSIIMPAYNAGKFISEGLESVLFQSYQNWELLIIDDDSGDNTADVAKAYQRNDARIKYFWQKNGKQGKARNKGIAESSGKYLAFMDADDIWLPGKLEYQIKMIEEMNADLVFGYSFLIEQGNKTNKEIGRGLGYYQGESAVRFLLLQDAFVMSTVFVKKEAIKKVGNFVEDIKIQYCEDWHIWLKLALENFSFYSDARVVSYYRIHEESATTTEKGAKIKFFYALLDLHHRYPIHNLLKDEVAKRAYNLVYHSDALNEDLIESIMCFIKKRGHQNIFYLVYKPIYRLSLPFFRKVYLYLNEESNT